MERTTGEVGRLLEAINERLDKHDERFEKHEERIEVLEKDVAVAKVAQTHVVEKIDRIDANITWLVRLVVSALITGGVGAVITLIVKFAFKV